MSNTLFHGFQKLLPELFFVLVGRLRQDKLKLIWFGNWKSIRRLFWVEFNSELLFFEVVALLADTRTA